MTATAPLEELLRDALDRLDRHERRMEMLESSVLGTLPMAEPAAAEETPHDMQWPTQCDLPVAIPARTADLHSRLAEAEERVRIAARLETVGRLVAGVAHDFNNLLTVIAGCADLIRGELPAGHHLRETAEIIANTTQTAATMTRQLVNFGRPSKAEPCPVDTNTAIRGIVGTLKRLAGERICLDFLAAAALPLIHADPGQFDQVLLNLVVNARDAIPADGTITIRTALTSSSDDGIPGDFVALTVTDTGAGMADDVRARVFDPFFTTKSERGTGLGLSTVRDIVRAAGGNVEVESSPGWGTSVRVLWPVYLDPADPRLLVR
jgi:signal transduction histidine kinase